MAVKKNRNLQHSSFSSGRGGDGLTILITGGAGFIGSHVVRLFVNKYTDYKIVNLDKLTYAGNLANLKDIEKKSNYEFVKGDICDAELIQKLFENRLEVATYKLFHRNWCMHLDGLQT